MARLNSWLGTQRFRLVSRNQKWTYCWGHLQTWMTWVNVEAKELAVACVCPAKDPGTASPCFQDRDCCQEPVIAEATSSCFLLGTACKKLPRVCIWHKLGCYCQVPKPYNYSVDYWSWLLYSLPGEQMKYQAVGCGQRRHVSCLK